jgi:hypothetical protein
MARKLCDMTEPELKQYMQLLGEATSAVVPAGTLFVLLVFDEPGLVQYVSSADRSDIIKAMRECADRLEAREDVPR